MGEPLQSTKGEGLTFSWNDTHITLKDSMIGPDDSAVFIDWVDRIIEKAKNGTTTPQLFVQRCRSAGLVIASYEEKDFLRLYWDEKSLRRVRVEKAISKVIEIGPESIKVSANQIYTRQRFQ